ncbi:MAG TPA: type II secretion system protein GspJ, partial [Burkholderiales bacterium]
PLEAPLLGNVEAFELRFFGQGTDAGPNWPAAAGPDDSLPLAVEVTLEVKGTGRFKRLFLVNR